jgi:homoserine dehydrogenase
MESQTSGGVKMASGSMQKTKVAIVGLGNVGSGVARLLLDHGDRTARHAGRTLWLEKAVVRDLAKHRGVDLPAGILTDDVEEVYNNPEIAVVAHLVGGLEPARTIMIRLLEAGKDVVTANKALLAEHGPELFTLARQLGRTIAFEASVAGGIPIVTNISQCLSANGILSLEGILNGTSNFILTKMDRFGTPYAEAVAEAQRLGYAEEDPTMDVDGSDAAQKLAILAHLAFGAQVNWRDIPRVGIDSLDVEDLRYAAQLGYAIKLLAEARLVEGKLDLSVSPTLIKRRTPLAEVQDAFNAVRVVGDAVGPVFYHGLGAGQMPTASAVVADLIDTAVGRTRLTFETLEPFSTNSPPRVSLRNSDELPGRYYFRLRAKDHPGTLAAITGVFGKHQLSIASVLQHERGETLEDQQDDLVPLMIMSHQGAEGSARAVAEEIEALGVVRGHVTRLRVKTP